MTTLATVRDGLGAGRSQSGSLTFKVATVFDDEGCHGHGDLMVV